MEVARPGLSEEVVFEMKPKCREGVSHTRTGDACAWRGTASAKPLKVWRGWRSDTTNCLGWLSGVSVPRLLTPDLEASVVIIIIVGRGMRACVCVCLCVCVKESLSLYVLLSLYVKDQMVPRKE